MAEDRNAALNMAMMAGGMYGPNPYSQFPNGVQGQSYSGVPTDALGKPIAAPPGMTLNQTPAQPQAPSSGANLGGDTIRGGMLPASSPGMDANFQGAANSAFLAGGAAGNNALYAMGYGPGGNVRPGSQASIYGSSQDPAMQARMNPGPSAYYSQGASNSLGGNQYDSARIPMTPFAQASMGPQGQPQQQPQQQTTQQPPNSYQTALQMLSNPGKVTTPGANVPVSQPITNQPSVLDQFLAAHPSGGGSSTGAGGYTNQPFFDTLNKLKGMAQ